MLAYTCGRNLWGANRKWWHTKRSTAHTRRQTSPAVPLVAWAGWLSQKRRQTLRRRGTSVPKCRWSHPEAPLLGMDVPQMSRDHEAVRGVSLRKWCKPMQLLRGMAVLQRAGDHGQRWGWRAESITPLRWWHLVGHMPGMAFPQQARYHGPAGINAPPCGWLDPAVRLSVMLDPKTRRIMGLGDKAHLWRWMGRMGRRRGLALRQMARAPGQWGVRPLR